MPKAPQPTQDGDLSDSVNAGRSPLNVTPKHSTSKDNPYDAIRSLHGDTVSLDSLHCRRTSGTLRAVAFRMANIRCSARWLTVYGSPVCGAVKPAHTHPVFYEPAGCRRKRQITG